MNIFFDFRYRAAMKFDAIPDRCIEHFYQGVNSKLRYEYQIDLTSHHRNEPGDDLSPFGPFVKLVMHQIDKVRIFFEHGFDRRDNRFRQLVIQQIAASYKIFDNRPGHFRLERFKNNASAYVSLDREATEKVILLVVHGNPHFFVQICEFADNRINSDFIDVLVGYVQNSIDRREPFIQILDTIGNLHIRYYSTNDGIFVRIVDMCAYYLYRMARADVVHLQRRNVQHQKNSRQ